MAWGNWAQLQELAAIFGKDLITDVRVKHRHITLNIRKRDHAARHHWSARNIVKWFGLWLPLCLFIIHQDARGTSVQTKSHAPFDIWVFTNILFQHHGPLGIMILVILATAGYALSQAQNWEALLRILGRVRMPTDATREKAAGTKPEDLINRTPHNLLERTTSSDRFVGRSKELKKLPNLLASEGTRVYLTGMGGVGKSELAIQYAYDSLNYFLGGIVRLDARQGLEAMRLELISFFRANFPNVTLPDDRSPSELLPLCWNQWPAPSKAHEPVLLILDDLPGQSVGYQSEASLFQGLPLRFRRLITQREPAPTGADQISLSLLDRRNSILLLTLHAGKRGEARIDHEKEVASQLCQEVGDLPLAIVFLGARLAERPDLKLSRLLANLRSRGAQAKGLQGGHPELGAHRGVVEALFISWDPLSESAKNLALLLATMGPAVIPWDLVEHCSPPDSDLNEEGPFADQQAELYRCQFLDRSGPDLYQLHPLIRHFVILQMSERLQVVAELRTRFVSAIAVVCRKRIPQSLEQNLQILTSSNAAALEPYIPHIKHVVENYEKDLKDSDLIWPTMILGRYHESQVAFGEARKWYHTGLKACESRLGPTHTDTATALNNLGGLFHAIGKFQEAKPLLNRALIIDESIYGPKHPKVARRLSNMAGLYKDTNRLKEAEPLYKRALDIDEACLGNAYPEISLDLLNLGSVLEATNRFKEAEVYYRRALMIDEDNHGQYRSDILNGLAGLLHRTNRLEEAELFYQEVIKIDELNYGNKHPRIAVDLNNYAQLLLETNQVSEAERLMRQSYDIDVASYGSDHPNVAIRLNNLAGLLLATNRNGEAERLYRIALAIDEATYEKDHPTIAVRLNNLAGVLEAQNRLCEAEALYQRALGIDEASYGIDHPSVAIRLNNLAGIFLATNRLKQSEEYYRRALAIDESSFGPMHPTVAIRLNNLANVLYTTYRFSDAESLYQRALSIDEVSFGSCHPNVSIRLNNLAGLLYNTGRYQKAEILYRRALEIDSSTFGLEHPQLAIRFNNLAQLLQDTERLEEAEQLARKAISIAKASYASVHPSLAIYMSTLAKVLRKMGRFDESEKLFHQSLRIKGSIYAPDHPQLAITLYGLGVLKRKTGQADIAETLLNRALIIDQHTYGSFHPDVARDLCELAILAQSKGRIKEAEEKLMQCIMILCGGRNSDLHHRRLGFVCEVYSRLLEGQRIPAHEIKSRLHAILH